MSVFVVQGDDIFGAVQTFEPCWQRIPRGADMNKTAARGFRRASAPASIPPFIPGDNPGEPLPKFLGNPDSTAARRSTVPIVQQDALSSEPSVAACQQDGRRKSRESLGGPRDQRYTLTRRPTKETGMHVQNGTRAAHVFTTDARQAAREFHASVEQPDMALVVFFCSSDYDLDVLGLEMQNQFQEVQVVGCTTAGEIGPSGYREHSLTGVSFSAAICTCACVHLEPLQDFELSTGQALGQRLLRELEDKAPEANDENSFAFLLIDGLSVREEPVARAFQNALGKIPLVGGSAGDGINFGKTYVYVDGKFRADSAALTIVTTPLRFSVFKTQHFVSTDQRLVITQADTAGRMVKEINGLPAAQEYARLLGIKVEGLDAKRFAASPVVVLIDGNNYVRSIQKVNSNGSLTFFCAIEEGLVLRIARGIDLLENLERTFAEVRGEIGPPQLVLGWDCILRRLEIVHDRLQDHVEAIFQSNNTVGFNTYGEQFRGVHVNQTLTGVALGATLSKV